MEPFEDYYKILQVHHLAEPEIIKAAYRRLALTYAPDVNKSPDANTKMVRFNAAYAILSDPVKRKRYDVEWFQRKGDTASSGMPSKSSKPKPIIEPLQIQFMKVQPGQVKRASFLIINEGGPYSKIKISNPDSWLRIVDWHSLSTIDELPLKVNVEATGRDWNKTYSENIYINLDEAQSHLTVTLQTRLRMEIKDHRWHDMVFDDLKDWVKKRTDRLNTGEELKGRTFSYRLNKSTNKYQIRLRHAYQSAVYDPLH